MTDRSRRSFLKTTAAGGAGMILGASGGAAGADEPGAATGKRAATKTAGGLSILMLGGTRFLGPAVVERAVERGHSVTLFNRGRSNPDLFDGFE